MNNGDKLIGQGNWNVKTSEFDGLTKREAFTMVAMQGLLANPKFLSNDCEPMFDVGEQAISYADQALAALEKS